MKILATIESVKVARQRQNDDGTWSPVYGIKLVSGDDEIIAESYRTKESLTKAGIIAGAVGKAQIEFKVKEDRKSTRLNSSHRHTSRMPYH